MGAGVGEAVGASVGAADDATVGEAVGKEVGAPVGAAVGKAVGAAVGAAVSTGVGAQAVPRQRGVRGGDGHPPEGEIPHLRIYGVGGCGQGCGEGYGGNQVSALLCDVRWVRFDVSYVLHVPALQEHGI